MGFEVKKETLKQATKKEKEERISQAFFIFTCFLLTIKNGGEWREKRDGSKKREINGLWRWSHERVVEPISLLPVLYLPSITGSNYL